MNPAKNWDLLPEAQLLSRFHAMLAACLPASDEEFDSSHHTHFLTFLTPSNLSPSRPATVPRRGQPPLPLGEVGDASCLLARFELPDTQRRKPFLWWLPILVV